MRGINDLKSLEDTSLWKRLNSGFTGRDENIAKKLSTNLLTICEEASSRMKVFPSLHSQYTLHDEKHLLRVTELMSMIIPSDVIDILNPVEIGLLILSAYFHDQGMVLSHDEITQLDFNPKFKLFKDNWIIEHPNFIDIRDKIENTMFSSDEKTRCILAYNELQDALLTDYIRQNHGQSSKLYIESEFNNNPMWEINGINISKYVGILCKSHNEDIKNINDANGFRVDENIATYKVNMQYIAIILRLADILDFDRDRTPDSIYKTIHFSNDVSIIEWEKHRSVHGWEINKDIIRFSMKCKHPIYQRAALQFMDWIDYELFESNRIISRFPSSISIYRLDIPLSVDRSRIEPEDSSYIYHDLEFSLSRDEIVKLLMTENLYESTSICIRELLQNSLDALRHRKNIFKRDLHVNWTDGKIKFKHTIDEYEREVVICEDNGIGMDENIIKNFLTKAGRSYYKSPEFLKEKSLFESNGIEFEPCSQFGIGFMSCFMLGESIIIKTRRDYGYKIGQGKPLEIEINGLNGIIVIREGSENQPIGTSIKIIGRNKPAYLDKWVDKVNLIEVLQGYALASEFNIEAECDIEEIRDKILIPNTININKTFMEIAGLDCNSYKTFEQDFSEINEHLNGKIRVSLLIDEKGLFTLENKSAKWCKKEGEEYNEFIVKDKVKVLCLGDSSNQTCCDGILVCGKPGRNQELRRLGWRANVLHVGEESFTIDIRGIIKPKLTPSRIPKENLYNLHPSWRKVQEFVDIAQGMLWGKILMEVNSDDNENIFMQLINVYRASLEKIPSKILNDKLSIPIIDDKKMPKWIKVSEIRNLEIIKVDDSTDLIINKTNKVLIPEEISIYSEKMYGSDLMYNIKAMLLNMSSLNIKENKVLFSIDDLNDSTKKMNISTVNILMLEYKYDANKYIVVQSNVYSSNSNHPLVKYAFENRYNRDRDMLTEFIVSLIILLNNEKEVGYISRSEVSRCMHRIGCIYKSIRWQDYRPEFIPNISAWTTQLGEINIGIDDFEKWSKIRPQNLNEF